MTAQLLAQALAIAYNERSTSQELSDAVGDLVAMGSLDAAEQAVSRIRRQGSAPQLVEKFDKFITWLRSLGPEYSESQLAGALAASRNANATATQLLTAAETLVVWGALDDADRTLARLRELNASPGPVARFSAASRQLRRSGILRELQSLTPRKSLTKPYEVLIRRRPDARRVIIVFTGVALRFWISLNALHIFLRRLDAHVIYLSDHRFEMYLNGLASIGPGYQAMLDMLRKQIEALGSPDLYVLATSAGGFVGLRTAIDLRAECFAGMSIRSSLEASGPIAMSPIERYAIGVCRDPKMLIDLRPIVEASSYPRRIQLYCGDQSAIDIAHSENLAAVPRVSLNYLASYRAHDAISGLIARGEFEPMLQKFISATTPAESAVAAP